MNLKIGMLSSLVATLAGMVAVGCSSSPDMTKEEAATFKNPPPMTNEARTKVAQAMASGAAKEADHEKQWRAEHPQEAAKMDAERAARGLAPIGG